MHIVSCLKRQCIEKRDAIVTSVPNEVAKRDSSQPFTVGSQVEIFSQDIGIRGCWFRASIIKGHKDKLKVQYQDIPDAADETKRLEAGQVFNEWILTSRVASLDQLGLRMGGRTDVRLVPPIVTKVRGFSKLEMLWMFGGMMVGGKALCSIRNLTTHYMFIYQKKSRIWYLVMVN